MTAPSVAGTTATTSNQLPGTGPTSQELNLPTGIIAGETLIMEVYHKCPVNEATISGWTRFIDESYPTGDRASTSFFWKKATGTEGATVTLTTVSNTKAASICRRWTGATDPTLTPPEGLTVTFLNTNAPNPPAYVMGLAADYMFVAAFASSKGRNASVYPAGYSTDQRTVGPNNGTDTYVGGGSAGKAVLAGTTDNPAAYTTTGDGTEEAVAVTYVISPAGIAGADSNLSGSIALRPISMARGKRIRQADTGSLTGEADNWGLSPHRVMWWNTVKFRWDSVLPLNSPPAGGADDWWICGDVANDATPMTFVDTRTNVRPDVRWDEEHNKLYVWMGGLTGGSKIYTYDYDYIADTYTVDVNGVATGINSMGSDQGGSFHRTPNGHLWVVANDDTFGMVPAGISFAKSTDGGATWSAEVDLKTTKAVGKSTPSHFTYNGTTYFCISSAENGLDVGTNDAVIHFLYIDQDSAGYATPANWTDETSSIPPYSNAFVEADDEASMARDENENLYIIAETEHLRVNNAGVDPQLVLFTRTPAGVWSMYDICFFDTTPSRKRPTISLDLANENLHIFYNRTNTVINTRYAPISNLASLATAQEDTIFSDGAVSFRNTHAPEHVNGDTDLIVFADNQTRDFEWFTIIPLENPPEPLAIIVGSAGTVYVAPVGTPGPTATRSTLHSAWINMGYLSEEGVAFREEKQVDKKSSWSSFYPESYFTIGRRAIVSFALREYSQRAVEFALEGTVQGTNPWTYDAHDSDLVPRALVVDWQDGDLLNRLYVPTGVVIADVESSMTRTAPTDLPIIFSINTEDTDPYTLFWDYTQFL